ncbi:hypothetical protein [Priestia megaterium]
MNAPKTIRYLSLFVRRFRQAKAAHSLRVTMTMNLHLYLKD